MVDLDTLEVRLGTPKDFFDLRDSQRYEVGVLDSAADWLDIRSPDDGATQRTVGVTLKVSGATPDEMRRNVSALTRMLKRAKQAHTDRVPADERVSLQLRPKSSVWTHADIISGTVDDHTRFANGREVMATIVLACLPKLRTEAIQAQNLLAWPCDPGRDAWTRTNVTVVPDDDIAPDGSQTAARLRETSATGAHEIRQEIVKDDASDTYTLSCYVKPDGRNVVSLYLADGSGLNGAYVGFDVAAGYRLYPAGVTGAGFSGAAGSIVPVGDGWYRCILTATSNADDALRAYVQIRNGSDASYAGDTGVGLLVWGIQIEQGERAGLLLVPHMLPDTVMGEKIEPGYVVATTPSTAPIDPNDLLTTSPWTTPANATVTTTADPTGGTAAGYYKEDGSSSVHRVRSVQVTTPAGANTCGLYIKRATPGRDHMRLLFSGLNYATGYEVTFNFATETITAPTLVGGTGYSAATSKFKKLDNGWYWISITQNMPASSNTSLVLNWANVRNDVSYGGDNASGIIVWNPTIVPGATVVEPAEPVPGYEVDSVITPAYTIATGKQAGAYIWPVPGDADALYRVELDDASVPVTIGDDEVPVAVNRVHIGAWRGRLNEGAPFCLLDAADSAYRSTGDQTQVGTWVAGVMPDNSWRTIGWVDDACGLPDGRYDVIARVRDNSINIGSPTIQQPTVSGAIYLEQVDRVSHVVNPGNMSVSLIDLPQTRHGSTLILMCQAVGKSSYYGAPDFHATITESGGLEWTDLFPSGPAGQLVRAQAWFVPDADPVGSTITVTWNRIVAEATVTLTLLEMVGAATDPLGPTDTDFKDPRTGKDLVSGIASATPTTAEVGGLAMAAGLGLNDLANPLTSPTTNNSAWNSASSLTSGSIQWRSIPTTDPIQVAWRKVPIPGLFPDPEPEGWYVMLALFRAAAAGGSNIGTGQWTVCVTAVAADGTESLPSERRQVTIPSSSSALTVPWIPPQNGTSAKYRVYRTKGGAWGYVEVAAPASSYTFTSETGITTGNPPTKTSPIAALRLAVAPASGRTIAIGRPTSVRRANGHWEPVALGTVKLPPVAPGEGPMPRGWRVLVQARNSATYPVEANGLWFFSTHDGQAQGFRVRENATEPRGWIFDTGRDELTTAVLMDGSADDGQVALVPGPLTLRPDGGAHISVRPDIQDGVSDLVNANLRITRVEVTPRWNAVSGGVV